MANKPIIVHVQATRQDRRVAFAEEHPDHPNDGQAWVVGDGRVVAIALTAEASAALGRKDIERVSEPEHPGLPNEELPNQTQASGPQGVSPITGNQSATDTGTGDTGSTDTSNAGSTGTGSKGGSKKG